MVLVNFIISRRVVREVCDRGFKAVFIKENIKCMILVAGFISNTKARSGSPLLCCSVQSIALHTILARNHHSVRCNVRIQSHFEVHVPHVLDKDIQQRRNIPGGICDGAQLDASSHSFGKPFQHAL